MMPRIDRLLAWCFAVILAVVGCGPKRNGQRMPLGRQRLNQGVGLTASVKRVSDGIEASWVLKNESAMPIWIPVLWQLDVQPRRMPLVFWNPPEDLVLVFGEFKFGDARGELMPFPGPEPGLLPEVDAPCKYKKVLPGETFAGTTTFALPYKHQPLRHMPNPFLLIKRSKQRQSGRFYWNSSGPAIPQKASWLWVAVEYSLRDPSNPADEALDDEIAQRYVANLLLSGKSSEPLEIPDKTVALSVSNVVEVEIPFRKPSKDAIGWIIKDLSDEDPDVRWMATGSVIDIGPLAKAVTTKLADMLQKEEDPAVRTNVAEALKSIGSPAREAVPALIGALADSEMGVREEAAAALGRIGISSAAVIEALLKSLSDKKEQVKHSAAYALGDLGASDEAVIDELIKMLKNSESLSCSVAAYSLGKIGPAARKATSALMEMLKNKDVGNRVMAAQALGNIGPSARKTIPALKKLLKDADGKVRDVAAQAIRKIQGKQPTTPSSD